MDLSTETTALDVCTTRKNKYTGAYLLSVSVFSERFSYWGLQAILVLFLIQSFAQNEKSAFVLVGAFGALSYASSLIGGVLADKLMGIWRSCILGLLLCVLGNTILFFADSIMWINLGLSTLLIGSGFFSPSSNNIVRTLYEDNQTRKDTAFLITCVAGNISGVLAPLIYGIFGAYGLWKYAFLSGIILNAIALYVFLNLFKSVVPSKANSEESTSILNRINIFIATITTILIAFVILKYVSYFDDFLYFMILPFVALFAWIYNQLNFNDKQRIVFIIFTTFILLLFYTAVFQIYSSLTIFIAKNVDRNIFGWKIPVPAFAALQCVFFIIFAPIVKKALNLLQARGHELSLLSRIPIGLVIGAMGFVAFAIGEYFAGELGGCGMIWIVLGNMCLGLGEVFLYPPILTAIATFSPKRLAGTFMGIFSISLALSSFLSGQLASTLSSAWGATNNAKISILSLSYAKISISLLVLSAFSVLVLLSVRHWYHRQLKLIYDNNNA